MYTVARLISRGVYTVSGPFHPFGGAVDIIVVEQPDGSYKSSPWYVRFGKFQGVLKTREKVVNIDVNGIDSDFHMYLDHKGEAFFLCDVKEDDENLIFTSPLSSGEEEINDNVNNSNQLVTESSIQSHTSDSLSLQEQFKGDVNLLPRTNSRRYRLLRYVFGRRASMGQEMGSSGDGSIERLDSLEEAQIAADLLEVNWSSSLPTTEVSNSSFNLLESNENDDETAVIFDLQNSNLGAIDAKPSLESEQISRECSDAIGDSLHEEGSQSERVSSYTDCETPDSFTVGEEKNQFYCETMGLISEVSSKRVSRVLLINEDTEHDLGNCNIQINEIGSGKNVTFMDSDAENIRNASPSLVNMHMLTAESVEPGRMQVIELKKIPERLVGEKKLESDVHEEFAKQSSMTQSSHSHTSNSNAFHLQGSAVAPEPQAQVVTTDKFISSAEDRELAESSDEEQFLFSDIDQLESSPVHCKDPISSNSMETETNPVTSTKDILKDHDSSLSLNTFVCEQPPLCSQSEFKESRTTSSAQSIPSSRGGPSEEVAQSIPSGRRGPSEEVEWMMESMPNIRSGIDNLDVSDVHPLSCSLDSGSESLGWKLFRKDSSKPFTSDIDTDNFLKESSNTCNLEELKRMSSIPEIEISLCKHLLYEGMGIDAASQAFDDEKVDPENFIAVASTPLNSDKLVVRMGGRYFPWDAAVPVISGMTSFGHELTFDPEGMIAVERTEETLEGKSPRSIVASGGSWRLWPFSSRQSRTIGSVEPGLDGTKCEGTDNASESSNYVSPDRNVQQVKVTTKKVKSIVPTSEQLASLHLKEGQNVIKFTFSTAMLGKQQVDARIFLWKYDARIVVSDVDGTITKSDVLGQFMPLVGKDWSQTGVAHLFSAIKENGYKFIYLSARSVSQAYLTRQFLINLKQDGKALPDGPVVISPDGLFPSLYREVIRRAPHEFKIGCLEDIKALFPPDSNPFYAGFGNRDTDEFSYLKVGVPKGKIFTINPKGEVAVHRRVDTKSYTSLHELVNGMFPAMCSAGQEEFNQWNFWKVPPLYIDC